MEELNYDMLKEIKAAAEYLSSAGYDNCDPSEPEYQILRAFRDLIERANNARECGNCGCLVEKLMNGVCEECRTLSVIP